MGIVRDNITKKLKKINGKQLNENRLYIASKMILYDLTANFEILKDI